MAIEEQDRADIERIVRTLRDPVTDADKQNAVVLAYMLGRKAELRHVHEVLDRAGVPKP